MSGPSLAERASQRRVLNLALQVACPRADHFHAEPGVPCSPPSPEHEWGWVCVERISHEVDSRPLSRAGQGADAAQVAAFRAKQERERRTLLDAFTRAQIAADVAAATTSEEQS